jgi:heavy metal sensor kinase
VTLTVRTRLTLAYAGILALLLALLGVVYYRAFARQLDIDATTELEAMTRGLHGYIRIRGGVPAAAYDRADADEAAFVQEATRFFQVYDATSGRLLLQSPGLEPLGVHLTPAEVRGFVEHPDVWDVTTDQRRLRFSNTVLAPAAGERYLMQVGVALDGRDAARRRFLSLLLWSVPAGMLVVPVVGRWMAGRALAPLALLVAAARTISVADLHRRLPVRGADDELDRLAVTFNDLVAHLERAVGDMREFSAAMAHELRTPLAAMRADMELSLTTPLSGEERSRAIATQVERIDDLTRLLGQLLTLARAEAGQLAVAREPVELGGLAAAIVDTLDPVARTRDIVLTCESSGEVTILGDRGWMERLLLNLIDNAIKFTEPSGSITVSVGRRGARARIAVRDSGIGISSDALPHIFERFYRADSSRSPVREGAGLGLSLVKWIAERHEGTIEVSSRPGHGSTFTVDLPLASQVSSSAARGLRPGS